MNQSPLNPSVHVIGAGPILLVNKIKHVQVPYRRAVDANGLPAEFIGLGRRLRECRGSAQFRVTKTSRYRPRVFNRS
jgi:hypothetical protein